MGVKFKRIYDPPTRGDGVRILVDGLWPRGWKKDDAAFDLWLKEIAPSAALRQWFGHRPERWAAFRERYFRELDDNPRTVSTLRAACRRNKTVTLLYAARDVKHNHAAALAEYLSGETRGGRRRARKPRH